MIRSDSDRPTICADCGGQAVARLREVRHANHGARLVSFDSHHEETDPQFVEMMNRVDQFHEQLHALQIEIRRACLAERELPVTFIDVEIDSIKPTACAIRTMIVPTALIQAFGRQSEIRLEARELAGANANVIVDELKAAAVAELPNLRARFEQGRQ